MKRLALIFVMATLVACSGEEKGPTEGMGCMTGIDKNGGTTRVLIRCCSHQEYLAGDNVARGGTAAFTFYKAHQWQQVDNCNECY